MTDIIAFQAGREARIANKPRDGRRNADWLRGWDQVDGDERIAAIDRQIKKEVRQKQIERDRLNPPVFIDPRDPRFIVGSPQ